MSKLKTIRESRGITQQTLSDMTGISKGVIVSWELGRRSLTNIYAISKLAAALGCDIMDLVE